MLKQLLRRILLKSKGFRKALVDFQKRQKEQHWQADWHQYFVTGGPSAKVPSSSIERTSFCKEGGQAGTDSKSIPHEPGRTALSRCKGDQANPSQ